MQKKWLWPGASLRKTGESPSFSLEENALNFLETDTLEVINNSISWSLCSVLEISLLTKEQD